MAKKRIGILTGGGDVPGLNEVIREVVFRADQEGFEVIGIRRGWGGLIYHDPDKKIFLDDDISNYNNHFVRLTKQNTVKIYGTGGTILHTSRVNIKNVSSSVKDMGSDLEEFRGIKGVEHHNFIPDAKQNIRNLGLDGIIPIGGDDTQSGDPYFMDEVQVVGVPKTMDNDIPGVEQAIGFDTAWQTADIAIQKFRSTNGSHERLGIIELFGRDAGFVAWYTAAVSHPDRLVIPEVQFDADRLVELLSEDRRHNPSRYAILIMAEGAKIKGIDNILDKEVDGFGHPKLGGIGDSFAKYWEKKTKRSAGVLHLTYDLRSGPPTARDKLLAQNYANNAIDSIKNGMSGILMTTTNGKFGIVDIKYVNEHEKRLNPLFYDDKSYRAIHPRTLDESAMDYIGVTTEKPKK